MRSGWEHVLRTMWKDRRSRPVSLAFFSVPLGPSPLPASPPGSAIPSCSSSREACSSEPWTVLRAGLVHELASTQGSLWPEQSPSQARFDAVVVLLVLRCDRPTAGTAPKYLITIIFTHIFPSLGSCAYRMWHKVHETRRHDQCHKRSRTRRNAFPVGVLHSILVARCPPPPQILQRARRVLRIPLGVSVPRVWREPRAVISRPLVPVRPCLAEAYAEGASCFVLPGSTGDGAGEADPKRLLFQDDGVACWPDAAVRRGAVGAPVPPGEGAPRDGREGTCVRACACPCCLRVRRGDVEACLAQGGYPLVSPRALRVRRIAEDNPRSTPQVDSMDARHHQDRESSSRAPSSRDGVPVAVRPLFPWACRAGEPGVAI